MYIPKVVIVHYSYVGVLKSTYTMSLLVKQYIAYHSPNLRVVGFCPIESSTFSFPAHGLAPRTFTEGEFSQAICGVEVLPPESRWLAKTAKPTPSTTLLKQSSSGAKWKREEKLTFDCLDPEGSRKKETLEPELLTDDDSSSDEDQDLKMPILLSSSGTTMSTPKGGEQSAADSEEGILPIFKSYNPDFISPTAPASEGGHEEDKLGQNSKGLSSIRQMDNFDKHNLVDVVEGGNTQMEVTSPPPTPVPRSQCLLGRKKDLNSTAPIAIEPTSLLSSAYSLLDFGFFSF